MISDVRGKVRNTNIPYSEGVIALFESIINSIHAIEEAGKQKGRIIIDIERMEDNLFSEQGLKAPIKSIRITDNGIGFNKANYDSFDTSDSTYKETKGGKGVGRFGWLKVFDHASVRSVYQHNGNKHERYFEFRYTKNGIENPSDGVTQKKELGTVVELVDLKEDYRKKFPITLFDLADEIINHHIVYFINKECPEIIVREEVDENKTEEIVLNKRFQNEFIVGKIQDKFTAGGQNFKIQLLRYASAESRVKHTVYYTGNNRVVITKNIKEYFPDLVKKLKDENGTEYDLLVIIEGKYLSDNVNAERTGYNFPYKKLDDSKASFLLTLEEIEERVKDKIRQHLAGSIEEIQKEKIGQIKSYVETDAPQYRTILNYPEYLENVQPGLSKEKLDLELYKIKQSIGFDARQRMNEILKTEEDENEPDIDKLEEYKKNFVRAIQEINDVGQSSLIDYIVHRKLIINLFEKVLSRKDDGKYPLEEDVHKLIFPMRKTSDDVGSFDDQNLWLIDERLSFHKYLASDVPLGKADLRPDILVGYDKVIAYSDQDPFATFSSIILIEFKRPMRKDYDMEDDNPVDQLIKYIRKIRNKTAVDKNGRTINVSSNCRFYCYIICDFTDKIIELMESRGFTKTPDENGYWDHNPALNAYMEFISFGKLLTDAKQRNKILFDKLNLPDR